MRGAQRNPPCARDVGGLSYASPDLQHGSGWMITAIVQYKLPPSISLDDCAAHFRKIAAGLREVPGLVRKQFIYAEDGWAGGVYLWQSRAAAQAFYTGPWLDGIRERYGMEPQIKFFETACIADNSVE